VRQASTAPLESMLSWHISPSFIDYDFISLVVHCFYRMGSGVRADRHDAAHSNVTLCAFQQMFEEGRPGREASSDFGRTIRLEGAGARERITRRSLLPCQTMPFSKMGAEVASISLSCARAGQAVRRQPPPDPRQCSRAIFPLRESAPYSPVTSARKHLRFFRLVAVALQRLVPDNKNSALDYRSITWLVTWLSVRNVRPRPARAVFFVPARHNHR